MRTTSLAPVAVAVVLVSCHTSGGGATSEAWTGTMIGTSDAAAGGGLCAGTYAENFTVSFVVNGALESAGNCITGTGTFSGAETVAQQDPDPSFCTLGETDVNNAPIDVTCGSTNIIQFESTETLVGHQVTFTATGDNDNVPVSSLHLQVSSIDAQSVTGTWTTSGSGSASGNSAHGTFHFTRTAVPTGAPTTAPVVVASAGSTHITLSWSAVDLAIDYDLYWSTSPNVAPGNGTKVVVNGLTYDLNGLVDGQTYYIVVAAANTHGEGPASATISATPGSPAEIAIAQAQICVRMSGGSVECFANQAPATPAPLPGITDATSVRAHGAGQLCARTSTGLAFCWGAGTNGVLGDGNGTNSATPVQVSGLTSVVAVEAGYSNSYAILNGGAARSWGYGDIGGLGNGSTGPHQENSPVTVVTTTSFVSIGGGSEFGVAATAGGAVDAWGAISPTGALTPQSLGGFSGVTAVAAGFLHFCALKAGTVQCYGADSFGQLGDGGPIPASGSGPFTVTGISTATAISSGNYHSCALLADATARCWGSNSYGELGGGTVGTPSSTPLTLPVSNIVSLAAGNYTTCAVTADHSVHCWGIFGDIGGTTVTGF